MRICLLVTALCVSAGCNFFDRGDPPSENFRGVGEGCEVSSQCRGELVCTGTCQPAGTTAEGGMCQLTGDCQDGLYCAADRLCAPEGPGADGASCDSAADCVAGLVCRLEGFYARCGASGEGDLMDECGTIADCLAGLSCVHNPLMNGGLCQSVTGEVGSEPPPSAPFWPGIACTEDDGPARSYFEVPRFDGTDNDFYRLPFPNDIRTRDGHVDLRNHAAPDVALDVDLIDRYLRAAENDMGGFSTNPVAYFRFSGAYDWDSAPGAIRFVDVDPDSPNRGESVLYGWLTTFGQITKYICEDWFAVRTVHGAPLRPGTTYAVMLTRDMIPNPEYAASFARDEDFDAVMADTEPSDPVLAAAWATYAPLRSYLAEDEMLGADDLLNAAVFTTEPLRPMAGMRQAVRDAPLPTLSDMTVCAAGVTSPCDDGTPQHACPDAATPGVVEIHGRVSLPIFQAGEAPYATPEDGGAIEWAGGVPTIQRTEDVCFALTLPEGDAPTTGWPLVIAAHGTGGAFTTAARSGLALDAATMDVDGSPLGAATLAIDMPQHGSRRHSDGPPDELFFNVLNPAAARDNVLQGSGDLFALVRLAEELALAAGDSPTAAPIQFDPSRIALYAHSQGATHADLMVPFESGLSAVVFSGNSGDLTLSLLNKTSPTNIKALVPFALLDADGDGNLPAGDFHPMLALFQMYFDVADPVNYARLLAREVPEDVTLRHVMMTFGTGDTYTTEANQRAFAAAAGLPHVAPRVIELRLGQADAGLTGNITQGDLFYTFGLRSYDPQSGDDGHFVATRTEGGRTDTRRFLSQALTGTVPIL